MKPQFLISSIRPGHGKTIFAMGLIHALRRRGMTFQVIPLFVLNKLMIHMDI